MSGLSTIQNIHPQQRYALVTNRDRKPEFVGSIGNIDVFWMQHPATTMLKFSSQAGNCYYRHWLPEGQEKTVWTRGHSVTTGYSPTAEEFDLAVAMCKCFVQGGRLPEWEEELGA